MFDFIRKKLKKTIKDASETIPEEELEEQEDIKETEEIQENNENNENKNKKEESSEDDVETTLEEEIEDITEPENKSKEEDISENTEEEIIEKDEINEPEDLSKEDVSENESEEKTEEKHEHLGLRQRLKKRREERKRKSKEKKEETSEDKNEETIEETSEDKNEETTEETSEDKNEETTEETSEDKNEETTEETSEDKNEETTEEEHEHKGLKQRLKERHEERKRKYNEEIKFEYENNIEDGKFSFITKKTIKEEDIEEILEELELSLIEGDVAFDVADKIVNDVKEDLIDRKIRRHGDMELFTTNALKKSIGEIIENGSYDLLGNIESSKQKGEPYKIMFVGINGTGKTTTIAKVAKYLEKNGYSSVFGASDTFRAGAIEQLEHHANNLNLKIIKHERNSDPAAVAYDAVEHAKATGKDVVLIDTSGRMQTNANLMDEMKKIKRVSKPDIVIYVGDALMGNDATEQASKFNEVIDIDGIILTKTDADAKGGAAISIGHVIHKPILFIGTGQSYDDLMEFKPEWMINQIFNDESEVEA